MIGQDSFKPEAWKYWRGLQARNRELCYKIPRYTKEDESLLSSLKLTVFFQACRRAWGSIADPYTITPDVLALAEAH